MRKVFIPLTILFISCNSTIKNDNPNVIIEPGTEIENNHNTLTHQKIDNNPDFGQLYGYWVGWFENAEELEDNYDKALYIDDGLMWMRENKINISIDRIEDTLVYGHSVVAGNHRPFQGTFNKVSFKKFEFSVKEPGDDKYDGKFTFSIDLNQPNREQRLNGTWKAYKKINIQNRKYSLKQMVYSYDADIMLEPHKQYTDWTKKKSSKMIIEYDDDEMEEWIKNEFASATEKIYEINASNTMLTNADVENLKQGDLIIIRNTIYARHGYSFKNRPLRIFFDAQSWYIPIKADIKTEYTEIEKKNIERLLKYEKNAKTYYDYFGRG